MICNISTLIDIKKVVPYIFAMVTDSEIHCLNSIGHYYKNIKFLNIFRCNITLLCDISFPPKMLSLDIFHNKIEKAEQHCFKLLSTVSKIILDFNKIQSIQSEAFKNLPQSIIFSFSNNPLNVIQKRIFSNFPSLKFLFIFNMHIFQY